MISWLLVYCLILILYVWYVWSVWYCTILIIVVLIRFMLPPCILNLTSFTSCVPAAASLRTGRRGKQIARETRPAWFEFDWQLRNSRRVRFEIYWPLRKFGASAFCKLLSERCWNSCCSVLSYLCFDTVWNLFRKSTAERERCCLTSDISPSVSCGRERCGSSSDTFSSQVASSWTLVFNADHQLDDHREFREASTEAAESNRLIWSGRIVSSDRVVPFHLVSVAEHGHAVRTVHRVTSHRLSSKSECVDPRRKIDSCR